MTQGNGPTVRVEGGAKLRRTLREAGEGLGDLRRAHKDAATIAADASAQLAPKRSGRLARDIRAAGLATRGEVRAGRKAIPYANPIHWGWFKRNIKPNPFISRGAQDSEGRWLPVYERALDETIKKVEGA